MHLFSFRIMELEKRNKKMQSTIKLSRKYAKGNSNYIFENKSYIEDVDSCLENRAECLKSKLDAHTDNSPTLQRDEVKS